MTSPTHLNGIYAAAVTPLTSGGELDLDGLFDLLQFLARRGCHGALLFGTTGEGPSFSPAERRAAWQAAVAIHQDYPEFRLLAGTGAPSLETTIEMNRAAFELGFDGVVTLPPFYYRAASEDGLFLWFKLVIERSVPQGGALFGYHFPRLAGIGLPADLLARLKDAFPDKFAGVKDSSGELETARQWGQRFGRDLCLLNGSDHLLSQALQAGGSGAITALANLASPWLRQVWEAHRQGQPAPQAQAMLDAARQVTDRYPPAPSLYKGLLARRFGFPVWGVMPPLLPLAEAALAEADAALPVELAEAGTLR